MARTIIKGTENFNKIDMLNSRNGDALKDYNGKRVSVSKLGILDVDEDGEDKTVGVIIDDTGKAITCVSSMAIDVITDSISLIDEEGMKLDYLVNVKKSKNDREFISLTVIEV